MEEENKKVLDKVIRKLKEWKQKLQTQNVDYSEHNINRNDSKRAEQKEPKRRKLHS